jgi:hypothetical protein
VDDGVEREGLGCGAGHRGGWPPRSIMEKAGELRWGEGAADKMLKLRTLQKIS